EFSLFAAVFRMTRNLKRLEWSAQDRSVALVKPLWRNSYLAIRRPPALHTPLKHAHTVSGDLSLLRGIGEVHGLTLLRTADMGEPRPGNQDARGFTGNVNGPEQLPRRFAGVDIVVKQRFVDAQRPHVFGDGNAPAQTLLGQAID